jgi:hypothetical protein
MRHGRATVGVGLAAADKAWLREISSRCATWWIRDFAPVTSELRFVFYGGLLVLALSHAGSPIALVDQLVGRDRELLMSAGVADWLHLRAIPDAVIRALRVLVVAAWLSTTVGLATRFAAPIAGLGFFVLHGLMKPYFGTMSCCSIGGHLGSGLYAVWVRAGATRLAIVYSAGGREHVLAQAPFS